MYFERMKTPGIAHISYILGDAGAAVIVDPGRDVERYLTRLRDNGLNLRLILETHRQEDFEMGGAALRSLTGAEIAGADHECMAHADWRLGDGDEIRLGDAVSIRGLATPGHTPESMCFAVTLAAAPERPWGVFTGDSLFIGDTGRTDLADPQQTAANAALLYEAIHTKILSLGDQALVLPAHGAGSACGGNVADRDHSTLGLERLTNAVVVKPRAEFIESKCAEQLARPPYFRLMERVNLHAGRPFQPVPVPWLEPDEFARRSAEGVVIDTREPEAFAGGHIAGAYSVWLQGLPRYGGWVTDEARAIYLIVEDPAALCQAQVSLARIGYDNVAGALRGGFGSWRNSGRAIDRVRTLGARELCERLDEFAVLDVREASEYAAGHIPGACNVHVGHLEAEIDKLDLARSRAVVSVCSVGHRGSLGASVLKRRGFPQATNLLGGMTAWRQCDLPLEQGEC